MKWWQTSRDILNTQVGMLERTTIPSRSQQQTFALSSSPVSAASSAATSYLANNISTTTRAPSKCSQQ